ncbi:pumilio-like protein 24 isoform X2 [Senna tora]|uniref:Pumilio-like protein 24 isoform X2 n=1 Tax=Senna tora TaxID=362788 RepID=A0A835CHR0_9FABA|nr:pumilio-like protein 24 isoform X2 [Senna tora]
MVTDVTEVLCELELTIKKVKVSTTPDGKVMDLFFITDTRLVDVISTLDLEKGSVLRHTTSVIQPILEKGIVDHSIIHRLLMDYFSIADKVLVCIISVVDDTKRITKAIIRELQQILMELVLEKDHSEVSSQTETSKVEEPGDDEPKEDMEVTTDEANKDGDKQKIN